MLQACYVKTRWFTRLAISAEGACFCTCGAGAVHLCRASFPCFSYTDGGCATLTAQQSNVYVIRLEGNRLDFFPSDSFLILE